MYRDLFNKICESGGDAERATPPQIIEHNAPRSARVHYFAQ